MASILFVWILPLFEVDPVWKGGVGLEVKVDGVVIISLDETGTNLRSEVRLRLEDSYQYDRLSCILLGNDMCALLNRVSRDCIIDSRSIFVHNLLRE